MPGPVRPRKVCNGAHVLILDAHWLQLDLILSNFCLSAIAFTTTPPPNPPKLSTDRMDKLLILCQSYAARHGLPRPGLANDHDAAKIDRQPFSGGLPRPRSYLSLILGLEMFEASGLPGAVSPSP